MKIMLIYPPENSVVLAPSRYEPLALEVLAATIPGHDVEIIDMRFESYSTLDSVLETFSPKIVGVTVNNTIQVRQGLEVLEFIKHNHPASITIVGGHHPSIVPEDFYRPSIDYLFIGWAEKSFPLFIKNFEDGNPLNNIPGIIILKNGILVSKVENSYDLQPHEIPFPRRDLTRKYWKKYRNEIGLKTALVNTARGCPFKCAFCSVWKATRGHYLVRPAEDVFKELISLPTEISNVFFADDNTFIDIKNAEKLCRMINESGMKRKYSGYCRSDTVIKHPDLLRQWRRIGLDNICVGFEATDDQDLKVINKSNSTVNNEKAAWILHDIGLPFRSYFLISSDFEEHDFKRISDYVKRLRLINPMFVVMTPLPGTDLWEKKRTSITRC